ncbi:MAG: hypothetical protein JRN46_06060 [Nitrososphaerota archaeon]|nr:hypothetical protein [Nitrososphaerota archaeon]
MAAVSTLLELVERRGQGPSPGFSREHALLAFLTIGASGEIGRQALARSLNLGEGSMRTVLRKFTHAGYVQTDTLGCHLTPSGRRLHASILRSIPKMAAIKDSQVELGKSQVAILVRPITNMAANGLVQRDSAVKVGATGAATYLIKEGKFAIPGSSPDCEKDFPGSIWRALRSELSPKDGDVVILCGAADETTAKMGALSAAFTLL